jgi:iron complex outermembrane receptor protein
VTRAGRATGFETIPLFGITDIWSTEKNSPEYRLNVGANIHLGDKITVNLRENIYGPQSTITSASTYAPYANIMGTLDIVDPAKINKIATFLGLPATTTPYYRQQIGVLATTNLEITYKPFESLSVGVGADNLFDKYPDKSPAAIRQYNIERFAATGARDYLLGSPVGFFGRRLFAKVNYNW